MKADLRGPTQSYKINPDGSVAATSNAGLKAKAIELGYEVSDSRIDMPAAELQGRLRDYLAGRA